MWWNANPTHTISVEGMYILAVPDARCERLFLWNVLTGPNITQANIHEMLTPFEVCAQTFFFASTLLDQHLPSVCHW